MLLTLAFCFLGVFFSYILNGYAVEFLVISLGEKILKFYMFMILSTTLCNTLSGKCLKTMSAKLIEKKQEYDDTIPQTFYFLCSVFQMGSMLCASAALAYITYPTQIVLKSSKPIAILFTSLICLSNRIHHTSRMLSTTITVIGVMGFMYYQSLGKNIKKNSKFEFSLDDKYIYGWGLVFVSLLFDGLLGYIQEKTMVKHKLNGTRLMYLVNFYSTILLIAGVVVTNEIAYVLKFFLENPTVVFYLFLIGITGAVGQGFIFYTVANFGPLTCSIITNVRKFFQIFLSVFLFSHSVSLEMWVCVIVVFLGLVLDIWSQFRHRPISK